MSKENNKRPRTPTRTAPSIINLISSPTASPAHKKLNQGSSVLVDRTSTTITPQDRSTHLYKTIAALPTADKDALLYSYAVSSTAFQSKINVAAQNAPVLTFEDETGRVELCVLEGEGGMNPTEWDIPRPEQEVPDVIEEILGKAKVGTRYETRRNAVFALGAVIELVLNGDSTDLEHGLRERLVAEAVEAVETLLATLSDEERTKIESDEEWETLERIAGADDGLFRLLSGEALDSEPGEED